MCPGVTKKIYGTMLGYDMEHTVKAFVLDEVFWDAESSDKSSDVACPGETESMLLAGE